MKPENSIDQTRAKNLLIALVFVLIAGLSIGTAVLSTVSAQKGVGSPPDSGAVAALQQAFKSGTFEQMSSAKQNQLLIQAGMKYQDGVLKPFDYPTAPVPPPSKDPIPSDAPGDLNPLAPLANPLVNNPALDVTAQKTQSETTIVGAGGTNLVAVYNDSGSFFGGNAFTGYSTSTDMGTTWTDRGTVPILTTGNFGDPVLARNNTTGTIFLSTIAAITNGMEVYRSTDNGVTWSAVSNGAPGTLASDGDKEWITVDNNAGTGNGNVYFTYRDFGSTHPGVLFTRSTDNGVTFGPSPGITIAAPGAFNVQGAHVSVGADHAVYVSWLDQSAGSGTANIIKVRKSTDQGVTFAAAVNVATLNITGVNGGLGIPAGYRSDSFPQIVPNPVDGSILYCVHNDINVAGTDRGDVYFQQSTDGGATWGVRAKINSDATTRVQAFPTLAVKPDGTGLCMSWYDNRNDSGNTKVERWAAIATISGTTVTFGFNFEAGNAQWTPVFGADPVVNTVYMGDYDQMFADNTAFYTTFVDCRLGDQDVRFAKIPLAGPGPVLSVQSFNPSLLNPATNTCTDLFITIVNNGNATATAVTAALSTATPHVTIQNSPQSFGNIAPGATATNATPYKLSVDNMFLCGTPIVIDVVFSDGSTGQFTINTQGLGYQSTTMTGQSIVPGTTDSGNHGDDTTTPITIPFTFTFYGQNFTSANVSSNGSLQFTSNNSAFTNSCIPTNTMNNLVSPFWDDLCTAVSCGSTPGTLGIFTSTTGVTPNRIFNVEWRAIYFSTLGSVNFELRLYETSGQIDFVYGAGVDGSSATAGIQKGDGSGGAINFNQFSCNTPSLSTGLKVSFTQVATCPTGTGACAAAATPCSENFDGVTAPALPAGWSATQGVNLTAAPFWVTSATTPDTPPNDAFSTCPTNILDNRLDTPLISVVSAAATLSFRNNYIFQDSGGGFDGGVLEISSPNINVGNFTDILAAGGSFATGGYNGTISSSFSSPIAGRMAWTGTSPGYITTTVNLPAVTNGQSIKIRWRLGADNSVPSTGWRIDTMTTTGTSCGGAPCVLTCPGDITTSNTLNLCGKFVTYPAPTTTGTCGTVTCVPPSGAFFPVGTTTVTCTAAGASPGAGSVGGPDTKFNVGGGKSAGSGGSVGKNAGPGSGNTPKKEAGTGGGSLQPRPPTSPAAVLYSQTGAASNGEPSQNFEASFDAFDCQGAEDFTVPAGQTWTVSEVDVGGTFSIAGPPTSINVTFFNNSGTLPGATVVASFPNILTFTPGPSFNITLPSNAVLTGGATGTTYWVSVQVNMTFGTAGQWFWSNYGTTNTGSEYAWRNPGGGFGTPCTTFGAGSTSCGVGGGANRNDIFAIVGTSAASGGGSTCTFKVTVVDTQPPTITCPGNITAVTDQSACPSPPCQVVTFPPPVATDNCPGVTVVCNPPSGVCFPTGTTTVTCTATDASGNTASCSFTVTVFDVFLQDDSDPSIILLWNSITGQYRFCCLGVTYVGVGKATRQGCVYTLETPAGLDRRILGRVDKAVHVGSGSLQAPPGHTRCTIQDRNTLDDFNFGCQ